MSSIGFFRAILERELNLFGNVSDKISGMPGGSYLGGEQRSGLEPREAGFLLNATTQPKVTRWGIWLD